MSEPYKIEFSKLVDGNEYKCYREVTVSAKHEYTQKIGVYLLDEEKDDGTIYDPHLVVAMQSSANIIAKEIIDRANRKK